MNSSHNAAPEILALSPLQAARSKKCPVCGEGDLFQSYLKPHEKCASCGLDFRAEDTADGPAFFAITLMGALIVALPAILEWVMPLPFYIHALIWVPFLVLGSLWMLRFFKAWMIALEVKHGILSANTHKASKSHDARHP